MTNSELETRRAKAATREERELIDTIIELRALHQRLKKVCGQQRRSTFARKAANFTVRCIVEPHGVIVDGLEAIANAIFD